MLDLAGVPGCGRGMRAHFVEGPAHGTTIQLEGNAPGTWYMPAMLGAPSITKPEVDDPRAPIWFPSHEYTIHSHVSRETVVYAYRGLSQR